MPHSTAEYSQNLADSVDIRRLVQELHETIINSGLFEVATVRTRAEPREMRRAADHVEQLVARGAANDVRDEHFVCFHDGTHRPEPQRSDVRFTL